MAAYSRITVTITHVDGETHTLSVDAAELAITDKAKRRLRNRVEYFLELGVKQRVPLFQHFNRSWAVAFGAPLDGAQDARSELKDQLAARRTARRSASIGDHPSA